MGNERRVTVGGGETVTWGVAVNWNSEVYNTQTNAGIFIDKIDIRTIHLLSSTHQDGSVWIRCRLLLLSDIPTVLLLIILFTKHKVHNIVSLIDGRYQSRLVRPCLSSLLFESSLLILPCWYPENDCSLWVSIPHACPPAERWHPVI